MRANDSCGDFELSQSHATASTVITIISIEIRQIDLPRFDFGLTLTEIGLPHHHWHPHRTALPYPTSQLALLLSP